MFLLLFSLSFIITNGLAKVAPDFIHPCSDTSKECLIKATQQAIPPFTEGLPSLGVPPLDPFAIDKLYIPLKGLNITFSNGKLYGLKTSIIDDMKSDLVKRFFQMDFHCNLTIKGEYQAKGQLLQFPVEGGGAAKIDLTNLRMHLDINTKYTKDKHGVNHFAIKDYKYTFDYGDKMTLDLEQLLKGNKEISDKILETMNKEWKTVAEDLGQPIVDIAVNIAMKHTAKFLSQVPYEELIYVPIPNDA